VLFQIEFYFITLASTKPKTANVKRNFNNQWTKSIAFATLIAMAGVDTFAGNGGDPAKAKPAGDTTKISVSFLNQLDKDEAIKCTRAELLSKEFITINNKNYPELLRITFQDLERGSREIILQKKMISNDEVKFTMPMDLIKETAMAVLIVMKGEGMYFKKIDLTEE